MTHEISTPQFFTDSEGRLTLQESDGRSLFFDLTGDFLRFKSQIKKGLMKGPVEKALEYPKSKGQKVIDLTCGTGKDALFFLALGYNVDAYERNPVVFRLLQDARERFLAENPLEVEFRLFEGSFTGESLESEWPYLYYDPMYSETKKSKSKARKEMEIFKEIVGPDSDQKNYIQNIHAQKNFKRLIIKRPIGGEALIEFVKGKDIAYMGKTVRIDTYLR
jgi:16S rRNA (guanine1516-N2)-methyltransferase